MARVYFDPDAAVKSFFTDPLWIQNTALGATFNALAVVLALVNPMLIPVSFIFWALVVGYQLRVMRVKMAKWDARLPEWSDWVDLLISGLTWLAVLTGFILFVIFIPVTAILIGASTGCGFAPDPRFVQWAASTFTLTFTMALFVGLLGTYIQANFAEEERMSAAFALFKVTKRLRAPGNGLFPAWLIATGLMGLSVIVPMITIVGVFLIPTSVFIAGTISATIVAQAWGASAPDPKPEPAPAK